MTPQVEDRLAAIERELIELRAEDRVASVIAEHLASHLDELREEVSTIRKRIDVGGPIVVGVVTTISIAVKLFT